MSGPPDQQLQRPIERLLRRNFHRHTRRDPQSTEIPEKGGIFITHPHHPRLRTNREIGNRLQPPLIHPPLRRRDRRAMRILRRIPHRLRHPLDQLGTRGMLQTLGLLMHIVPSITEPLREIAFDDPMTAQ